MASSDGSGFFGLLKSVSPFNMFSADETGDGSENGESGSDLVLLPLLKQMRDLDHNKRHAVIEFIRCTIKKQPIDDRKLAMHMLMEVAAKLPEGSNARTKVTNTLITGLWDSLDHPPMGFQGPKHTYRMADGSNNNPHFPDLGRAGTPYAKSVQPKHPKPGVLPDPGLLFDLLMKRQPGKFKVQPTGINSLFFAHAALIIHDIFRTNRKDPSINDNSSYIDLSTLYGSSEEAQKKVRTMSKGMLKPDTFHDERLIGQAVAPNVVLVLYSRFHNYVAEVLLQINENGRFSCRPGDENGEAKQDEDLFQTARLIVQGLFINICLYDYLRAINNIHHSDSTWTLDPRVDIPKSVLKDGTDRGVGNQVSSEFNLLYRFHSCISQKDEKWIDDFFGDLFEGGVQAFDKLTPRDMWTAMAKYEESIPDEPSEREFGGLKRGPDGKFNDADLVRVLQEAIEDPAGAFGAQNVPAALRVIEIAGINQARQWQTASLNELRTFFKLKPHATFEDINPDPEIADTLRNLYGHPDNVETYPGVFVEDCAWRMDPGSGICAPFTVERAILSDAITLIRSDRFNSTDFNVGTLTSWGMNEIANDTKTLGGSMFYKLIQRTLPGWFPFNSLHVMQPMYTKEMNTTIAEELGVKDQYTTANPSPPPHHVPVLKHSTVCKVMSDPKRFALPWGKPFENFIKGRRWGQFMLSGDTPENREQRNLYGKILYGSGELQPVMLQFLKETTDSYLRTGARALGKNLFQIDVLKDVAIPVMSKLLADLFVLDLKTDENPDGSYNPAKLYDEVMALNAWGLNNDDHAQAWNRRRRAHESMERLIKTTEPLVKDASGSGGFIHSLFRSTRADSEGTTLRSRGKKAVAELIESGRPLDEVVDLMIYSALGGVGAAITMVAEILHYLLVEDKTATHLAEFQSRVRQNTPQAEKELRRYVLEIQRITTYKRSLRVVTTACKVDDQSFKPGDYAMVDFGMAGKDPAVFPEPEKVKLDRPLDKYIAFGHSAHECFCREIGVSFTTAILKRVVTLPNVRPAPGEMGVLKRIFRNHAPYYLSEDWSTISADASSWKLHFDASGSGLI